MADVLIKGMKMPTSCPCELLGTGYDLYCSFALGIPARVKEYYECCQNNKRPSWCPLVPVPPHGRLIDADRLHESMYHRVFDIGDDTMWQSGCWVRYRAIEQAQDSAPTVIEASEEE